MTNGDTDTTFRDILARIRAGTTTTADAEYLERYVSSLQAQASILGALEAMSSYRMKRMAKRITEEER